MQSRRASRRTAHQQKQDAITVAGVPNVTRAQVEASSEDRRCAPGALSRPQEDDVPFRLRRVPMELNRNLGDELHSITGV